MHIRIICLGKMKEKYLQQGVDDYLARLKPYARVEWLELAEVRETGEGEKARLETLDLEAQRINRYVRQEAHQVILAEEGTMMTSLELANYLEKLALAGKSKLDMVIGSHLGLSASLKQKADLLLSLSALTFPHLLARLILLEQLYRSFKIRRGEPYHK